MDVRQETIASHRLAVAYMQGGAGDALKASTLKAAAETLQKHEKASVAVVFCCQDGALSYGIKTMQAELDACRLAETIATVITGRSGGRQDMAQGGGKGSKQDAEQMIQLLKDVLARENAMKTFFPTEDEQLAKKEKETPMMAQYKAGEGRAPGCVGFFSNGRFLRIVFR